MFRHFRIAAIIVIACMAHVPASAQRLAENASRIQSNALYPFPACTIPAFNDVPTGHIFCNFIKQLAADGITVGCGAGNFCPNGNVTRGEMAVFMEAAMRGTATWSPWQGIYAQTIIVSPVRGGTEYQNGTALSTAIADISDESSTKRYLVKIEPGIYNFGVLGLLLPQYVDLEGSGRGTTILTNENSGGAAAVNAANGSQIRSMTIQATGGGTQAIALALAAGPSRLSDLEITATGGTADNYGINELNGAAATIERCSVSATGPINATAYALRSTNATVDTRDSQYSAQTTGNAAAYAIWLSGGILNIRYSTAKTTGGTGGDSVALHGSGTFLTASHSEFVALNGTAAIAVEASGGSAILRQCLLTAGSASFTNTGASITAGAYAIVRNSDLFVSGTGSRGIDASNSLTVASSTVLTGGMGINFGSGFLTVDNSVVSGSPSVSVSGSAFIGASRLDGSVSGTGTKTCVGVYNGSYAALGTSCS